MADLTAKSHDAEASIAQLKSQLEELIQAKEEDETALLQKFRDLLNEKKVKIREQQRVMVASGSFNASLPGSSSQQTQPAVTQPTPSKPARKAGQSRATKRKAPATKRVEEESEDEIKTEAMDVDQQEDQETDPGNTTEGTASVASDDEVQDKPVVRATRNAKSSSPIPEPTKDTAPRKKVEQPPARRNLPFSNRKPTKAKPAPVVAAGSETESDDEL